MDEVTKSYLGASVFSFEYLKFMLTAFAIYFVVACSIVKVVGEKITLTRSILSAILLSLLVSALRRFIPSPYNMLLFHVLTMIVVAVIFKLSLKKSFIGVIFALLLTMLSAVLITMNLIVFTGMGTLAEQKFPAFFLMSLSEVFFNLVYVLLATKYKNLNLRFLFSEEKNVKA